MKALEILKAIFEQPKEYDSTGFKKSYIQEAIAELKELQAPKTCETCKYKYIVSYDCTECRHNDSPIDYLDLDCFPDFGCILYEPKDS